MILKPTQSSPPRYLNLFALQVIHIELGFRFAMCNICTAGCSSVCQASATPQDEHSEGSCLDNQQHYCWKQHSNPGYLRNSSYSEMLNPFWPIGGYGCRGPAAPHRHPCQGQYFIILKVIENFKLGKFNYMLSFRATSKHKRRLHGRSQT